MTLEFHKLTAQVEQLGEYAVNQEEEFELKVEIALQLLLAHADPAWLPEIDRRVQDAIDKDAGYRGARPLDEPIMNAYPPAELPASGTLVATDGSQIMPNTHGAALYYLINTGTIVVHHGSGEPPAISSQPYLFYDRGHLYTAERGLISPAVVGARRTVAEMAALSEHAWGQRGEARPLLAMLDGPLLFVMSAEVPDREQLRRVYFSAMSRLMEVKAGLVGYIDRPRSSFFTSLLHLLDLPEEEVSRRTLSTDGRMEGLRDRQIFEAMLEGGEFILNPAERTAIFVQMSPQNKEFRNEAGDTHEIAFFYMNVQGNGGLPEIVRIEVPMWVAHDRVLVAELQALIFQQCQQMVTNYPYVLTRADELAVVKRDESRQLDTMIKVSLTRQGLAASQSSKQSTKDAARGLKTRHEAVS